MSHVRLWCPGCLGLCFAPAGRLCSCFSPLDVAVAIQAVRGAAGLTPLPPRPHHGRLSQQQRGTQGTRPRAPIAPLPGDSEGFGARRPAVPLGALGRMLSLCLWGIAVGWGTTLCAVCSVPSCSPCIAKKRPLSAGPGGRQGDKTAKGLLGCGIAAHKGQGRLRDSARDVIKPLGVRKTELTLLGPLSVCGGELIPWGP